MYKLALLDTALKLFFGSGIHRLAFQVEKAPNDPDPDAYLIHIFSTDKNRFIATVETDCTGSCGIYGISRFWWRKYAKCQEDTSRREQEP